MKRLFSGITATLLAGVIVIYCLTGCNKTENPIKYQYGTFPDSVFNLTGLNSQYDDYNTTCYLLGGVLQVIFSSNRGSSGGQYDLVQGQISFSFDQTNGNFSVNGQNSSDPFYGALISKANTDGNDFGPYAVFSSSDGYEYFIVASQAAEGDLDLYYLRYLPFFGSIPPISGPYPIAKINSSSDDAYIAFDFNRDSVYFCSDRDGDYDIYALDKNTESYMDLWFDGSFEPATAVDSVNSSYDDKCPFLSGKMMVFASDRPGGLGGFDLYYSIFRNGKWNSPVNFGPGINSSSDEYRPLIDIHPDYTNAFMVFSSNRPGGNGGYDLYFTGFSLDE